MEEVQENGAIKQFATSGTRTDPRELEVEQRMSAEQRRDSRRPNGAKQRAKSGVSTGCRTCGARE